MIIDLHNPTTVVFGRGRLGELGRHTKAHGGHALLVCGRRAMREHGVLAAASTAIEAEGLRVTVFDGVSADPRAAEVDAAADLGRAMGCDVVVGLGGGSAIDAAKAAALGLRFGPVGPLVGTTVGTRADAVPVVAVPTTGGSGAEVTKGAIITDEARALKSGIRGADLFPRVAIIDPDLLLTVPAATALAAGFDALAHAVEGHVARRSNPVTRLLAEQTLELLKRRLPMLAAGVLDEGTREDLALAALLGGLNVANASTCLPHRLQQAMGAVPGVWISHGNGLASVYPAWLRRAIPHAGQRFGRVAEALGADDPYDAIGGLLDVTGAGGSLTSRGFTDADLELLVGGVTGNTENDPIPEVGAELVRAIYQDALR